jgi:hypothetical protein
LAATTEAAKRPRVSKAFSLALLARVSLRFVCWRRSVDGHRSRWYRFSVRGTYGIIEVSGCGQALLEVARGGVVVGLAGSGDGVGVRAKRTEESGGYLCVHWASVTESEDLLSSVRAGRPNGSHVEQRTAKKERFLVKSSPRAAMVTVIVVSVCWLFFYGS